MYFLLLSELLSKSKNTLQIATSKQTVNLLRFASMVRIRPPPPLKKS